MNNQDIRWIQRFDNYKRALSQLKNAIDLSKIRNLSILEEQGVIQGFEYTHELAWKTLKDFLNYKGNNEIYGSRDATREAFRYNILENGELWMEMIKDRNKTSHTYNEDTADDIVKAILNNYYNEFVKLSSKLSILEKQE